MARPTGRQIRDEVLDTARGCIQECGVAGFSYGDIAEALGISTASVHHHFRTKADLVGEVAARYSRDFSALVSAIDTGSRSGNLRRYADLFGETAAKEVLCLCGAVAADWPVVGTVARDEVAGFFADQHKWLTNQIAQGIANAEFRADLDVEATATLVVSALEGSLLMGRPMPHSDVTTRVASQILALICDPTTCTHL